MKKLILFTAAAMIATCVQAASVVWSSTATKDPAGTSMGSSTLYTAVVTFWADNAGVAGDVISTTGLTDGSAAMSKYTGTTGDSFAANTSYWAQLVLSKNDGTASITSEKSLFTTDSAASYEINFTTGNGFNTASPKIEYTSSNWQTTSAPEPTSGILLLLGMAGLALKRKVA